MSLESNYFVIAGFNFSGMKTKKYEVWRWSDEGSKFLDFQYPGEIQLFDDPVSDRHLYLGYIFAAGDEYDFPTREIHLLDIENVYSKVKQIADVLIKNSIIQIKDGEAPPNYKLIIFEEAR